MFTHFYHQRIDAAAEVVLQGVQHCSGDPFEGLAFDGDDNVCLDFRYTDRPQLTWWFDHHVSAFQPPRLRAHFEANDRAQTFYDPTARSNTTFMARVLREQFGHVQEGFDELFQWADIIDGAQFPDARTVVELADPRLKLMSWLEQNSDPELTHRYIHELGKRSLAEIASERWIQEPLQPILVRHEQNIELIRDRAECSDGVVFFDLMDDGVPAYNKFISYLFYPDARYTISLLKLPTRCKISVGANPWGGAAQRVHNIAEICERYGGGGHPVVGAISVRADQMERARQIAAEIRAELAHTGRASA